MTQAALTLPLRGVPLPQAGEGNLARAILAAILAGLAVASGAVAQETAQPYAEAIAYQHGQARAALAAVEAEIRTATPGKLRAIEDRLLATLGSPQATGACKDWVCRQLRIAGSERCAAAVAPLLADKDLATVARLALQGIPGAKVDAALRDALTQLRGDLKAGVALSIGARRDAGVVPLLAPLLADKDPAVVEAALYALGQIGSADALAALTETTVPDALKRYRLHAILLCAERMAANGRAAEAAAVYRDLFENSGDAVIQIAALRGILSAEQAEAAPLVVAALEADNRKLRLGAARLVCQPGGAAVLGPVLGGLSDLPKDVQVVILGMAGDKAALPAAMAAAKGEEPEVRAAALGALGRLGNATAVPLLLEVAAGKDTHQTAARQALERLRGRDVDTALVAAARQGQGPRRLEAIRALAARQARSAVPALLELAGDEAPQVRVESLEAVGALAGCQALGATVKLLAQSASDDEHRAAEKAVIAICQRTAHQDWAAERVLSAMPGQTAAVRCSLLRVVGRVPCAKSLEALRAASGDAEAAVADTAVRGLAAWPDPAPMADLLGIARSAKGRVHKVLALRGVIRMAGLPGGPPPETTVKMLAEALSLAPRAEEKKMVLGALAEIGHTSALDVAAGCLADEEIEVEAAAALVKIAKKVRAADAEAAKAAVKKVLEVCKAPAARQVAESALVVLDTGQNIAPQGVATSPDDLEKDGTADGDQAAIDSNPATYWDEEDGKKLYRLVVTLKQPEKIAAVSITGWAHHNFAPRDFEVLCDGKVVKKVENAQYDDNFLIVGFDPVTATAVELKITGYYGGSPAVRELGIYRPRATK